MTKFRSRKWAALLSAAALPALFAATAFAQADASSNVAPTTKKDDEPQKMDAFEVTGSRVKRLDVEAVSPVTRITFDQMQLQGFTTVGDAIRALPFNSGQSMPPTASGNSFTPGISTVNLRSLGNNSTLVLINGRRAVPFSTPGFNGFQTMFDLNSIPEGAIDHIEILKDGGSAIYGSDAVAGVLNFVMKKNYQGLETSTEVGNYFNTDGLLLRGSAFMGTSSGPVSISVGLSVEKRNSVFARDVSYAAHADKRSVAMDADPRYYITGYKDAGFATVQDYIKDAELTDPVTDGFMGDNRSTRGFPGYVVLPSGQRRSFSQPTNTPTTAGAVSARNLYDFQQDAGFEPQFKKYTFYTAASYDFSQNLSAFTELSFARTESVTSAAATPADIETSHGLNPADQMVLPSYNPYNPWQVDITTGRRRMVENGARDTDVTSDTPRVLAGLRGKAPGIEGWTWESAVMYSKNSVDQLAKGVITDSGLQEALMGLTRQSDGSLKWDPSTPQSQRVYFNWFGTNSTEMARFLETVNPNSSYLEYVGYDFSATGPVFQLPAGPLNVAIGGEHRSERFANIRTEANATGNILGGSEGSSSFGDRRVTAFYAEADVPILKNMPFVQSLEAQLAARYEQYSDPGFAKRARPKFGLKWRPLSWLILRASYAKSFKAPDMAYLFTAQTRTFSSDQAVDPVTGKTVDQFEVLVAGNRNLHPELTDTWYAGFVIAPESGRLKGFELSFDWFHFQQKQLLAQLSDLYGYGDFLSENAKGNPLFAGKVVRDPVTKEVLYLRDDYVNVESGEYRGADISVGYTWNSSLGRIYGGIDATWVAETSLDGDNLVGTYLNARWNGNAKLTWSRGDWGVNLFGEYRGRRTRTLLLGSFYDAGDSVYEVYTVKPQYTMNASVAYKALANTTVTVGVNNVFDSRPPVDPLNENGTTIGVNEADQAFWYVRLDHKF